MTKTSKRKLNRQRVLIVLVFLLVFLFAIFKIFTTNITNIYINGNTFLTDQEIIDIAEISDYPRSISNLSLSVKRRLEANDYILESTVVKRNLLSNIYIDIVENYPLFYYQINDKYVLYDGKEVEKFSNVPTVINQIPNTIYPKFINKIKKLDKDILYKISEIKYDPNEVDDERFFLLMNDGNYVYITLYRFSSLNRYLDMMNLFENQKGILHLDSGEYFEVFN